VKILLLGSGAREHALARALARDPQTTELVVAPGNPGTAAIATNLNIDPGAPEEVVALAAQMEASSPLGADAPESEGAEDPDEPEDGAADAEEEVSEEASGAAEDGAVDEAGSPVDVLDSAGSCEEEVVGSAAEIVDGLAGLLTPEARSMLTRSPQSRVFAPILQLRLCPASSSGRGTCQTAWEAEELSPRATRVSRRSAITRRIIS